MSPRTERVMTRGEESLLDRLRHEAQEIERLKARLAQHRRWRDQLILKARRAGFTVREVEQVAGVSNPRVSQIERNIDQEVGG